MNLEIISIGQELLIGQTINTNAAWIAQQVGSIGISVSRTIIIPDSEDVIRETITESFARTTFVIVTGGLGPTRDDVTKKAICQLFETELIQDDEVLQDVITLFSKRGLPITDLNRQQALVPKISRVLRNNLGTAPGLWLEKDGKVCVALPGVPYEMKGLILGEVIPLLKERIGGSPILHRTILTEGIGESFLAALISDWESNLPPYVSFAYLPSPGIVKLRLSAMATEGINIESELKRLENELVALLPGLVWGYDNDTLEGLIGLALINSKKTISTAESCTGGFIAHKITSIAGSSKYFNGSIVAYSNKLKTNMLNIDNALIENYGAVSKEVVEVMATNGRELTGSDYCIATSGIAGPDGGSPTKPVGTIWITVASANGVESKLLNFGDNRERNIVRTSISALSLAKKIIDLDFSK
jgi:nicotinamide-nucleotide amidase